MQEQRHASVEVRRLLEEIVPTKRQSCAIWRAAWMWWDKARREGRLEYLMSESLSDKAGSYSLFPDSSSPAATLYLAICPIRYIRLFLKNRDIPLLVSSSCALGAPSRSSRRGMSSQLAEVVHTNWSPRVVSQSQMNRLPRHLL